MITCSVTSGLCSSRRREAVRFARTCCDSDRLSLGFLPYAAFDQADARGNLVVCSNNADFVGYVLIGRSFGDVRIYSTFVRVDARLLLHGFALVEFVELWARQRALCEIRLWCREDLSANYFWRSLGFDVLNWRYGGRTKKRRHYQWRRLVGTAA